MLLVLTLYRVRGVIITHDWTLWNVWLETGIHYSLRLIITNKTIGSFLVLLKRRSFNTSSSLSFDETLFISTLVARGWLIKVPLLLSCYCISKIRIDGSLPLGIFIEKKVKSHFVKRKEYIKGNEVTLLRGKKEKRKIEWKKKEEKGKEKLTGRFRKTRHFIFDIEFQNDWEKRRGEGN